MSLLIDGLLGGRPVRIVVSYYALKTQRRGLVHTFINKAIGLQQ